MKLAYFLETLLNVSLGYRFTLYSYGPFDQTVLEDIDLAKCLGALRVTPVSYPSGVGYSISAGERASQFTSSPFVREHETEIEWVLERFGEMTAAELELASTIVFTDRERGSVALSKRELAQRVQDVKPHFPVDRILSKIEDFCEDELILSCA